MRENDEVGARAAASRSVWYPRDCASSIVENGALELVIFDCPVMAKRLGGRFLANLWRRRSAWGL